MWNKKKIFVACIFFLPLIIHSKQKKFLTITKCEGLVQTRHIVSQIWDNLAVGSRVSSQEFIRLNSLDSMVHLQFPDGSELRLMGITSIFIDDLSIPKNQYYQSKFLLLSGRWFYSNVKNESSRIIINTEYTTSVLENATGGGFLNSGTQEFLVQSGRGLLSYRKPEIDALVLDDYQMVTFKIHEDLKVPVSLSQNVLHEYLIFTDTRIPATLPQSKKMEIGEIENMENGITDLNLENIID